MSECLYAVHFLAKECRADNGWTTLTKDNEPMWVTIDGSGWVPATSHHGSSKSLPLSIKIWKTYEEAEEFMKSWKGHPWYNVPKTWEVIRVVPKTKQVFSHYEIYE